MGDAGAWRGVTDAVVFLCCVWACPLAGAVGIWLAFVGVRRALGALGRGGARGVETGRYCWAVVPEEISGGWVPPRGTEYPYCVREDGHDGDHETTGGIRWPRAPRGGL